MDALFDGSLGLPSLILLILALILAFGFEFVNGFHDTANAVATVIYTNSLRPTVAVVWSGVWNFIGVLTSSGAVAFGIIALLPIDLVMNTGTGPALVMVFALLLSAILWNLGTWYFGLPASSSHTLIGSIVGVGLMHSMITPGRAFGDGVNWGKVQDTGLALLVSPLIGFSAAMLVLWLLLGLVRILLRRYIDTINSPETQETPPLWIRGLLILTCTGVSFAHGSNDGQKGMGLVMLILIGVLPVGFALNRDTGPDTFAAITRQVDSAVVRLDALSDGVAVAGDIAGPTLSAYMRSGKSSPEVFAALAQLSRQMGRQLAGVTSVEAIPAADRATLRSSLYLLSESIGKLAKAGKLPAEGKADIVALRDAIKPLTTFIPLWVKAAVAFALGLGTMIGWKRIVVTVGEKIGQTHLTYAQGASAEMVAMSTIAAADLLGLPVSTTHVLSSGIAGTMVANRSGLQFRTLRNVLMAWVLTLPVCVFLGAALFAGGLNLAFRLAGGH